MPLIRQWKGLKPKQIESHKQLGDVVACHDVQLTRERIDQWRTPRKVLDAPLLAGNSRSLYRVPYGGPGTPSGPQFDDQPSITQWFWLDGRADLLEVQDGDVRRYITNAVRVDEQTTTRPGKLYAYTSLFDLAFVLDELGVPRPLYPPACVPNTVGDGGASVQRRYYVYTYVTGSGKEGPPSPVSNPVDVGINDVVIATIQAATGPTTPGQGPAQITKVRFYETLGGDQPYWAFKAEYDYQLNTNPVNFGLPGGAGQSFDPTVTVLGSALKSTDFFPPPDNILALASMKGDFIAGVAKHSVHFSEPGFEDAWPPKYEQKLTHPAAGACGVFGNTLVVPTISGPPNLFTGVNPGQMQPIQGDDGDGCVSAESVIQMGEAVAYATHSGMIAIGAQGRVDLTADYWTPEQWRALKPQGLKAAWWRDCIVLAFPDTTFFLKQGGVLTESSMRPQVMLSDRETGRLYYHTLGRQLAIGLPGFPAYSEDLDPGLYEFDAQQVLNAQQSIIENNGRLTSTVRTGPLRAPSMTGFACLSVGVKRNHSSRARVRVFYDEQLLDEFDVYDDSPEMLPPPPDYNGWYHFELLSEAPVDWLAVAGSRSELEALRKEANQ